jgi:hypothetical protein
VSATLAMRVTESTLPSHLKWTLVVLALYATDSGDRVFPSVARVAWQLGVSDRQARANIAALCALGVLVPVTPRKGGAGKTTEYRIDVNVLPAGEFQKPGSRLPRSITKNPEVHFPVQNPKPGSAAPETRKCSAENPEVQCTKPGSALPPISQRSVRDQSGSTRTAAQAPRFVQLAAAAPSGGTFSVVRALAWQILNKGNWQHGGETFSITTESDLRQALKDEVQRLQIDRGADDVVTTAAAAVWHQARAKRIVSEPRTSRAS